MSIENSTYSVASDEDVDHPVFAISQWLNGPIERNYGFELAPASCNPYGFGFDTNVKLQRA